MNLMTWVVDIETQRLLAASATVQRRFGRSEAELQHLQVQQLYMPEDQEAVLNFVKRASAHHRLSEMSHFMRQPLTGGEVMLTEAAACRIDFGGRQALLFVVQDASERLEAESRARRQQEEASLALAERTQELDAANVVLDSFSYLVSHDIRSPLHVIDGFSAELEQDSGAVLDERGRRYLSRIREAVGHIVQLSDDMLRLSRVARQVMRLQTVDLHAICRSVVEELRSREPQRQVSVELQRGLTCVGDEAMLRLLMGNLIGNAWKFTAQRESAWIRITAHHDAQRRCDVYSVADNGAGFDMSAPHQLFKAFQRLHSSREFPGTGVGLAIVQRVVKRHGGEIWAESQPRVGSTFSFTLGPGAVPPAPLTVSTVQDD